MLSDYLRKNIILFNSSIITLPRPPDCIPDKEIELDPADTDVHYYEHDTGYYFHKPLLFSLASLYVAKNRS